MDFSVGDNAGRRTNAELRQVPWHDNAAAFVAVADWLARAIGTFSGSGGADANGCIVVTYTRSGGGGTHPGGWTIKLMPGKMKHVA